MANKYNSTVRTFMARELGWAVTGSDPVADTDIPTLAAPANLSLTNNIGGPDGTVECFTEQPYRANWGGVIGWNKNGTVNIKRVGVFSNFADGLVFSAKNTTTSRLGLQLRAYTMYIQDYDLAGGYVQCAQAFNDLRSDVVDWAAIGSGFFLQTQASGAGASFAGGYLYSFSNPRDTGAYYNARLSGNALTDNGVANRITGTMQQVSTTNVLLFPIVEIPTLNTMYDIEQYFDLASLNAPFVTNVNDWTQIITCQLVKFPDTYYDGTDAPFEFLTKSIDTGFNGEKVTFDSIIEVEVTPE